MASKAADWQETANNNNNNKKRWPPSRPSDEQLLDEIDYRLDYRIGWPKPLPVLPLVLSSIPDESLIISDLTEARRNIATILQAHDILWDGHFFFAHHHKHGTAPGMEDVSLVIPSSSSQPGTTASSSWVHAVKEIRKYLASKDVQCRIEIIDFEMTNPTIFPIDSENPAVDLWQSVYREKVLDAIQDTLWQSVNVFHCGFGSSRSRTGCPLTIIIHAWDADDDIWWTTIIPRLTSMCPFQVRLQGAQDIYAVDGDGDVNALAKGLSLEAFTGPVDIGASIGIKGMSGSGSGGGGGGTLGGIVELEWPDKSRSYLGLTSHHAVLGDNNFSNATKNHAPLTPSDRLVVNKTLPVIQSPSDTDTTTKLQAIEEEIDERKKQVHGDPEKGTIGWEKEVELLGKKSKAPALKIAMEYITQAEKEKVQIREANRSLGHVVASSGTRTVMDNNSDNSITWGLDWALIQFRADRRRMRNRITGTNSMDSMGPLEGLEIEEWSVDDALKKKPDLKVSKKGSRTGWTDGMVNAIKADINLLSTCMSKGDNNGVPGNPYGKSIAAWVACSAAPGPSAGGKKFCSAGDNGSLVFDSGNGDISGLIFGSQIADGFGFAYFVPFSLVVEDIERVTGGRVISPSKREAG
ncbi:hypothetical protein FQN51_002827 [Onygenales sp. PD_10]|nr:hypothetical protein FQN51_002827 [Onygenales sp. PD_10]